MITAVLLMAKVELYETLAEECRVRVLRHPRDFVGNYTRERDRKAESPMWQRKDPAAQNEVSPFGPLTAVGLAIADDVGLFASERWRWPISIWE